MFGGVPATHAGFAFYDLDKIVFASDCPFDPEKGTMYTRETLRILEGIDMPKADKEKIWHGNLERDHRREVREVTDSVSSSCGERPQGAFAATRVSGACMPLTRRGFAGAPPAMTPGERRAAQHCVAPASPSANLRAHGADATPSACPSPTPAEPPPATAASRP